MKKILLYASLAITALFAGCDLNINDDPNYPMNDQVTADLIFPLSLIHISEPTRH